MANVNWEILTPPSVEPVNLADMKAYLRVDYGDEDGLIQQLISDAREYAEKITGKALAPQTIRATIEPDPVTQGRLSGIVGDELDIYEINERITTVPFGYYSARFALPFHPVSQISVVEYQLTPFDGQPSSSMVWTNLPALDSNNNANYLLDTNVTPMTIILYPHLIANRYRFTYTAGYGQTSGYATGACPFYIVNQIKALVSFWFDNRQGQDIPQSITNALASRRIFQL